MLWSVAKEAAQNWSSHKDLRQGAALAYYSVFSIGPLIIIAVAIAGFVFGDDAVERAGRAVDQRPAWRYRRPSHSGHVDRCRSAPAGPVRQPAWNWRVAVCRHRRRGAAQGRPEYGMGSPANPGKRRLVLYSRAMSCHLAVVLALGFLLMISLLVTTALAALRQVCGGVCRRLELCIFPIWSSPLLSSRCCSP